MRLTCVSQTTGLRDTDEAIYYLDSAEFDIAAAVKQYKEDLAWSDAKAKASASPSSCVKRCSSASGTPTGESLTPSPPRQDSPPPSFTSEQPLLADQSSQYDAARPARPNLLQEVFCGCFFSTRSRRR